MFVKFTFYRIPDAKPDAKPDANKSLNKSISQILEFIQENNYITTSIAADLLNLKKTRINEILNIMINQNLIIKTGASRSTKYILK